MSSIRSSPSSPRPSSYHTRPKPKYKSASISFPTSSPKSFRQNISAPNSPPSPSIRSFPQSTSSPTRLGNSPKLSKLSSVYSPPMSDDTGSMSYFPPFEDMGSIVTSENPQECSEAGPSNYSRLKDDRGKQHGKGNSLGSIAGFMSWASPFTPTEQPLNNTQTSKLKRKSPKGTSIDLVRSTSSGNAGISDSQSMSALAKKLENSGRRVLEPVALPNQAVPASLLGLSTESRVDKGIASERKLSEAHPRSSFGRRRSATASSAQDEFTIEHSVDGMRKRLFRAQKHHLSLPPPPLLPNWRFPLPSPPITSLSPEIPKELFEFRISNPASTSTSPIKQPSSPLAFDFDDQPETERDNSSEIGDVEGSLILDSGSTDEDEEDRDNTEELDDAVYVSSSTSPTSRSQKHYSPSRLMENDENDVKDRDSADEVRFMPRRSKFRRTSSMDSRVSVDSKETIKVKSWIRGDNREGEITPRVGRGWKSVNNVAA